MWFDLKSLVLICKGISKDDPLITSLMIDSLTYDDKCKEWMLCYFWILRIYMIMRLLALLMIMNMSPFGWASKKMYKAKAKSKNQK